MVFLLVVVTGLASLALTGGIRSFAIHRNLFDQPSSRSSHTIPTPRGGGAAVVSSSALGMILGSLFGIIDFRNTLVLGGGMFVLGLVGWVDDNRELSPRRRLAIQLAVASWTVYMLGGLPLLRVGSDSVSLGTLGYVLAIIGIVWSINLFNFMDGIDGLAASQAVLIFATIAILLFVRGDNSLATIATILVAASAGFLAWNWPPAKIFLGDVGSGPIGYLIAALALASENHQSVPLFAFAIIYGVFIADASVTLIRRLLRGDRITQAHRDHAYQRLTRAWGSHKPVTKWAAAVTTLLAIVGAVGTMNERLLLPSLLVTAFFLACLFFTIERRAPM